MNLTDQLVAAATKEGIVNRLRSPNEGQHVTNAASETLALGDGATVTYTTYPDEKSWREETKGKGSTLGSSDAPVILGVGYKSQFALWAEKTGQVPLDSTVPADRRRRLRVGRALEPEILAELQFVKPELVLEDHVPGTIVVARNSAMPWAHSTADARIQRPWRGPVELKSVDEHDDDWGDEASLYALIQNHHAMLVEGAKQGLIAAWVGLHGKEFLVYEVPANVKLLAKLEAAEKEFDACVRATLADPSNPRVPPIDGDETTLAAIKAMYPKDNGREVILDLDVWKDLYAQWTDARERKETANEDEKTIGNMLRKGIGENTFGLIPGVARFSYKQITVKPKHCEACGLELAKGSTYRRLLEVKL